MKNYYSKFVFFALLTLGVVACKKVLENPSPGDQTGATMGTPNGTANRIQMSNGNLITGFNVKWNKLPVLSTTLSDSIKCLEPAMLRYPGGTITHKWDWQSGMPDDGQDYTAIHKIQDVVNLSYSTGTKMIFVIDIFSTMNEQLQMLRMFNQKMNIKAGTSGQNYIEYVELGNEIYGTKYQLNTDANGYTYKTGEQYAIAIEPWATAIKNEFNCKIGVSLVSTSVGGNDRKRGWNRGTVDEDHITLTTTTTDENGCPITTTVIDTVTTNLGGVLPYVNTHPNLKSKIDAYIYHLYIAADNPCTPQNESSTAEARIEDFEALRTLDINEPNGGTAGKEIWITEYGNLNDTENQYDLEQLGVLTNYIQSNPDITIALNHVMVAGGTGSPQMSKLDATTLAYTSGGNYFLRRANPVVINEIYNSQGADGAGDAVELLVVQNGLDMRNLILKKFGANGTTDNGVAYTFTSNSLWANLKSGTLIVIRNGTDGPPQDFDASDYTLNIDVNNTNYFTKGSENPGAKFNVANNSDMWMIKNPNFDGSGNITGTTDGISNAIHTFAAGSATFYLYNDITGSKLYSSTAWSNSNPTVYCINSHSTIFDYREVDGTEATSGSSSTLGNPNNATNADYISQLQAAGW